MRPTALRLAAPALLMLVGSTGCFRTITDEVLVRDPHQVSVLRADGTTTLPAGAQPEVAVHQEGTFDASTGSRRYRVLAERDAAGRVTLRCDTCASLDGWATSHTPTVVDADGILRSQAVASFAAPSDIGEDDRGVDLRATACMLSRRHCAIDAKVRLATPWENVVAIRRRASPDRAGGRVLLAVGALSLLGAVASSFLVRAEIRDRAAASRVAEGAVLTGFSFGVGVGWTTAGIWHLAAPAEERPIHPVHE